jgi:hypothetical protein
MVADPYQEYRALKRAFAQTLGYHHQQELPANLIADLAAFCDAHAGDMMISYYAASLVGQFWRTRHAARRDRFVQLMNAAMASKPALLALLLDLRRRDPVWFGDACYAMIPMWDAIRDTADGCGKANQINHYAKYFLASELPPAYECALAMTGAYRARALAGLYPFVDAHAKAQVLSYLFGALDEQCWEATAQLKLLFPSLDAGSRSAVVQRYLESPGVDEGGIAYFVIRNAAHIDQQDAGAIAVRVRTFDSDDLRIRCLLKLARHLPSAEMRRLCDHFMASVEQRTASVALIHNLYHVSTWTPLSRSEIVSMALRKIAQLDDSRNDVWEQEKYSMLSFLAPHMEAEHEAAAFAIAATVRGGYRHRLRARLRRNLATPGNAFDFRPASIIH